MSKEIDERVLSMQFDNALFEKNIQKSLKSIDDLNKSLNNLDGAKGLEEVSKAAKEVDLTPIIASAKNAEKSFSALEIAGITTISRLTNSLIDFGAKMGNKFWNSTIGQIKAGGRKRASDIKAGKFMLEGLGFSEEQVKDFSKAASDAVTDTAAGLGEAMKAAGVLATSGLKDAEKMRDTLKGIAGMSAMTGRSFENIANIYSTVASNGKLMTMQLRQFSFAGINVAAKLAESMGTTEEAINEMVTKGEIDFQTFSDAMNEHFGKHAKEANKTFSGALANMKAALSRIGERFATPLMDNLKEVFNNFRVFFNAVNKALEPVYQDFEKLFTIGKQFIDDIFAPIIEKDDKGNLKSYSSAIDNIVAGVRNLYSGLILIIKTVGEAFKEVFPPIEDGSESFKELTEAMLPTRQGLELLKTVMIGVFKVVNVLGTVLKGFITGAAEVIKILFAVIHAITGVGDGIVNEFINNIAKGIKIGEILEDVFGLVSIAIIGIGAAIMGVVGLISKFIKKLGEFFKFDFNSIKQIGLNIISGICKGLEEGFGFLQKVWNAIVNYIPNTITSILKIKSPSRVMMSVGANVILGIAKGMDSKETVLEKEVDDTGNIFTKIIEFGASIADALGKTAYSAIEALIGIFKKFTGKVTDANLKKTTAQLVETKEVMNDIYMSGNDTGATYTQYEKVGDNWVETNNEVDKSTNNLKDNISSAFGTISSKIEELGINIDAFKLVIAGFGIALVATLSQAAFSLDLLSGFGRIIATLSVIAGAFILFKDIDLSVFINNVKDMYKSIKMIVDNSHILDKIKDFFGRIREIIEENGMILLASKALAFSFAIVMIRTLHNLSMFVLNISTTFKTLGAAVKSLTTFKFGLYETTADKILKFAIAISAIVASMSLLGEAFAKDPKAMWSAVGVVAAMITFMTIFTVLTGHIAKTKGKAIIASSAMKQIQSASWALLALVASFILLATQMEKISYGPFMVSLYTFIVLIGVFAAFIRAIDKVNIQLSSISIIGMSILLIAIGHMMKTMAETFKDVKDFGTGIGKFASMVGPILAALAGVALILKALENTEKKTKRSQVAGGAFGLMKRIIGADEESEAKRGIDPSAGKTLLAIAATIAVFAGVIKTFSTLDTESMYFAVMGCMTIIATFGLMCLLASHYQTAINSLTGFARDLGLATAALAASIYLLADLDDVKFINAYSKVVSLALTIAGILVVVGIILGHIYSGVEVISLKIKGIGATLAGIAVGIAMLGLVFSLMPEDRLQQFISYSKSIIGMLLLVATILNVIGILVKVFHGGEEAKVQNAFANMASIMISLGVLVGSLVILSLMDPYSLLMPLVSLISLLVMLAVLFRQAVKVSKDLAAANKVFYSIAATIGILSLTLVALALIPVDNGEIFKIALGLALIIGALGLVFLTLDNFHVDDGTFKMVLLIGGILAALSVVLTALTHFGGENAVNAAYAIAIIAGVVAALTLLLGIIGKIPGISETLMGLATAFAIFCGGILAAGLGIAAAAFALGATLAIIGAAIKNMQDLDYDKVSIGLIKIAGAIFVFGAAFAGAVALVGAALSILVDGFSKLMAVIIPAFVIIGGLLMVGLKKGIRKEAKDVYEEMADVADNTTEVFKDETKIESPSKVFRALGQFLMKGLDLGIIDGIPLIGDTLHNAVQGIIDWLNGKAAVLEETGDTWGNALSLGLKDSLGVDLNLETPKVSEELDSLIKKYEEDSKGAAASTDIYSESAENAAGKTDNLKNSIANALDMFSGFDDTAYLTGKDVLSSFQDQINGVMKWRDELSALSARGLGEVIIQELESLGPQAYEKVHAFYTMTNSELAMMNIMYKQKLALQNGSSKKIAKSFGKLTDDISDTLEDGVDEMGNTLNDSVSDMASNLMNTLKKQLDYEKVINQVTGFRDNIADKIRSSMSIFEAVGEQEEVKAEELLKNMKDQVKHVGKWATMITEMAGKGFSEGLVATLTEMGPQSYSKVAAFLTMSEEQIAEANRLYEASEQVPEYGADKIVKAFAQAGFTASMGLTDSFLEGLDSSAVEQAMDDLGTKTITTLQESLNTPYTAEQLGDMWAGNFASGLESRLEEEKKNIKEKVDEIEEIFEDYSQYNPEFSIPHYNQGTIGTEAERKASDDALRKMQQLKAANANKGYYDIAYQNQLKAEAEKQNVLDNLKYSSNNSSDEIIEKALKKLSSNNPLYKFTTSNYRSNVVGNNSYRLSEFIKNGVVESLRQMASAGDEEAGQMADYIQHIIDTAMVMANSGNDYTWTASKEVAKSMAEQFGDKEVLDTAKESGESVSDNYVGGTLGTTIKVRDINREAILNSPLAKGTIQIGEVTSKALAETTNDVGVPAMEEAGENVAGAFIMSLRDNLLNLLSGILDSDDGITSPKIKPVIDGSDIFNGFKSLFNKNIDLSTSATIDVSTKTRDRNVVDAINGISNKEVVDAVNDLKDLFNMRVGDLMNLNVVMDTGALVGQLGHPMDLYLGQQIKQAGRGN